MNVSKGEVAKSNDLKKSFGTDERNTVAREVGLPSLHTTEVLSILASLSSLLQILSKGEVQVGEKEREHDIAAVGRPSERIQYPCIIVRQAFRFAT